MDASLDARQPWEKKAQRINKWIAGSATVGLMLSLVLLDVGVETRRIAFGILVAILSLASLAIMSFPGSTGFLHQPVSPFPRFAIALGLLMTGAGIALLGTSSPFGPATIMFGPLFIVVGLAEFGRRRYILNKEATA